MTTKLTLRPAVIEDVRFFWEVNNDPTVRAQSIATDAIPWDDHVVWYERSLEREGRFMFVVESQAVNVGVLRFDLTEGTATISVALAEGFRGRGLGPSVIRAGCDLIGSTAATVVAYVRPDNAASFRAFEKAGFERASEEAQQSGVTLVELRWRADGQ